MTTKAVSAQGVTLQRGDGATPTEAFATIAEILDWQGPTETAKQIDATSLDSTAREYIPGLLDGGEVSGNFIWVGSNTQQQGLRSDLAARVKRNFKLTLTDTGASTPTIITFTAVVTDISLKGQVDDKIMGSFKLKISGTPVFTYPT